MAVYVDDAGLSFGRMVMCHMIADSTDELLAMARTIGVAEKWIQKRGHADEHFDICRAKRVEAVRCGAIEVGSRELVKRIRARRNGGSPASGGGE